MLATSARCAATDFDFARAAGVARGAGKIPARPGLRAGDGRDSPAATGGTDGRRAALAQMFVEEENRRGTKQIAGLSDEALDRTGRLSLARQRGGTGPGRSPWRMRKPRGPKLRRAICRNEFNCWPTPRPAPAGKTKRSSSNVHGEDRRGVDPPCAGLREAGTRRKPRDCSGMTRPRLYRRLVQLGLEEASATNRSTVPGASATQNTPFSVITCASVFTFRISSTR